MNPNQNPSPNQPGSTIQPDGSEAATPSQTGSEPVGANGSVSSNPQSNVAPGTLPPPNKRVLLFAGVAALILLVLCAGAFALLKNPASTKDAKTATNKALAPASGSSATKSTTSPTIKPTTVNTAQPVVVTGGAAQVFFSPAASSLTNGSTLTIEVRENSHAEKVNAVQASFSYPKNLLQFVSVDTSKSAFGVAAEATGKDGIVKIGRGNINPLTGDQFIANVTFKVTGSHASFPLQFITGTAIVSSVTNKNVMGSSPGATYTIK